MFTFSARRPVISLVISVIIIAGLTVGAGNLTFRGDYRVFFSDENPELNAFEELQRVFSKTDNVVLLIAPHDKQIFTPERLALITALTEKAWQTPYSTRVESLTNYQYTYGLNDDLIVEDFIEDPDALNPTAMAKRKKIAISDPIIKNYLLSPSAHVSAINITVNLPEIDKSTEVTEIAEYLLATLDELKATNPDIDFHLSGVIMLNYNLNTASKADIGTLVPLMLLIIFVVLALVFRSLSATISAFIIVIMSVLATMGTAGWAGMSISMATVNVPLIVITLAIADCVHIIFASQRHCQQGTNKLQAVTMGVRTTFVPVIITSVTTIIGFLSFNTSEVPPIKDLGNMVAFGVFFAAFLAVFTLPALLVLLPLKSQSQTSKIRLLAFSRFTISKRHILLPVCLLGIGFCGYLIPKNTVDDMAVRYFAPEVPFRASAEFMEKNLSGYVFMDFKLDSKSENGIVDPEFMRQAESFSNWLRLKAEVAYVATYTDTIKKLNKNLHADNPEFYALPDNQSMAAQYLLLLEMSLPYGLDMNNRINIDKSAARATAIFKNIGSKDLLRIEADAKDWISHNANRITMSAASPNLMFAHISERNITNIAMGTIIAFVLISALLIIPLKSVRLGGIALIGMIAPSLVCFGLWALYNGEINLGLSIVASMTLGVVVDDIVHFLSKFKYGINQGMNAQQAIEYVFESVGPALINTTIILSAGFLVLTGSTYLVNQNLGLLTTAILIVALLIDLILIPITLYYTYNGKPVIELTESGAVKNAEA
ncbi:efflux RND transporter permease subunit [Teredinibacter purpureus]|uniref:efflux RND transporter permease subunit n=1 Tax=Teredinibacter purpureus TaxID=2731756 RepID=UPI0005F779C4|nr:efflux RND transporter permease subunit [Teredinibacter purpureus]